MRGLTMVIEGRLGSKFVSFQILLAKSEMYDRYVSSLSV